MARPAAQSGSVPRVSDEGWLVGVLVEHGKAPYRHDPANGTSYFIRVRMLETERGAATHRAHLEQSERPLDGRTPQRAPTIHDGGVVERWGADLERAIRHSRSHVEIGQTVAVKIVERQRLLSEGGRDPLRYRNTWEVETVQYVAQRNRFARTVNENRRHAREDGIEGKEALALYMIQEGAERLATVRYADARDREAFLKGVRNFFAVSADRERLIARAVERIQARTSLPSAARERSREPPTRE